MVDKPPAGQVSRGRIEEAAEKEPGAPATQEGLAPGCV